MSPQNEFSAASSALGYFYQARYALLLLLQAGAGNDLSIERLDDVAFEQSGEPRELLQFKHSLIRQAGLTDASPDIWKTLRVWSTAVSQGQIDLDSVQLTLVSTATAPAGSAAAFLRPDDRDETTALGLLAAVAEGAGNAANVPAYTAFKALSQDQQRMLLARIVVLDLAPNVGNLTAKVKHELTYSARSEHLDALCDRLEGWWFKKVVSHLSTDPATTPRITQAELRAQIDEIREQLHPENLPIDFAEPIQIEDADLNANERVFVEQLRLVMVDTPRIKKALSDYYRAFKQRSKWVDDELLLDSDLVDYEKKLIDEWERLFEIMREDLGAAAVDSDKQTRGRALFNALDTATHIPIRPRVVERYIMRGSYHILANSLRVGWHPDFKQRLLQLFQRIGQPA